MLARILKEFRESDGGVNLNELGRRMGVERSALDGMLATLVRQGRLREIGAGEAAGGCHCSAACPGCAGCGQACSLGKAYELVASG